MSSASYPKAIASWTNRLDQIDTVWAADPNSLAAEILAVEQSLGAMPQVEGSVPVGNPVTYPSVGARISDTLLGNQKPYVSLYAGNFNVPYVTALSKAPHNTYRSFYDPWHYFNGTDATIQADGLYAVRAYQLWDFYTSGFLHLLLAVNNVFVDGDLWNWGSFPVSGPYSYASNFAGRFAHTTINWLGALKKGDRVSVISENMTPKSPYRAVNGLLHISYQRALPAIGNATGTGMPG